MVTGVLLNTCITTLSVHCHEPSVKGCAYDAALVAAMKLYSLSRALKENSGLTVACDSYNYPATTVSKAGGGAEDAPALKSGVAMVMLRGRDIPCS